MVAIRKDAQSRYDAVPDELKQQKQWARYRKIGKGAKERDKVPANLDGSVMEWVKKPESKLFFDQVKHFDKIGCFPDPEYELFFVDWDGCIDENGNIHPDVLPYIKDTYAEKSVNERGIKAWYKRKKGTSSDNKPIANKDVPWSIYHNSEKDHYGIEIYFQKHFTTVTGNIIPGCPSEISEAPDDLLTRFAPKPKEKKKIKPKEPKKKTNDNIMGFDTPDGYWRLDTWRAWCLKNLTIKEDLGDSFIIECPWEHLHTTPSIKDTKIWFGPPHTFHCFHAHCDGRTWNDVHPVEHKQSRSVEQSIKHFPFYPEITMQEQMQQIAAATSLIEPAIREHMEADDGKALVISFPQGTGKTYVTAGFVAREKENIITAWMSPTKEVANSVPALREIYHIQACSKHNCPEGHKYHHATGGKGYNTRRSVHKYHECNYQKQPFEGETVVFNQQYYKSGYPASHDLVINDEANLPDWLEERKITIPQLQKVASWKTPDSEDDRFLRAVQSTMTDLAQDKPVHGKPIFDRLNRDSQLTNWLGVLIKKYANLRPKTNVDLNNDELDELTHIHNKPDVILPHLVKALAEELAQWQSGKQWNSRISIRREKSGEVVLCITEPRQLIAGKGEKFPPFVHLDGCVDEEIHSRLFGRELKILRAQINPAPGTKHLAVRTNKFYGKTSLTATHKDGSANKTLARTVKEAKYMLAKVNPDGSKKVALISHMDCVDEIAEALGIPESQTGYYWNIRGSNSLEHCDVLLLIGTPILPPQKVATMARSLYHDDPEPICEDWTRENGHDDPRLKHLAQFLINSELTQAAHRVRPIQHPNKTIISFCEGDIDFLPITETFTSLPYMTEEGENLHTTNKEAAYEKVRIAYAELSKDGNSPTTEEVRKHAHVKRNTVVEWMQENVTSNVNTQHTEENKSTHGSIIIDYIDLRVPGSFSNSDVPRKEQQPMDTPRYDNLPHYKGIERGAKVMTPLGQGRVIDITGHRGQGKVSVLVESDFVDGKTFGWKRFDWKDIQPVIEVTQQPLLSDKFLAGLDELFAGVV